MFYFFLSFKKRLQFHELFQIFNYPLSCIQYVIYLILFILINRIYIYEFSL